MTKVLDEAFNNLNNWTSLTNATIVAGRTGTGLQVAQTNGTATYLLGANESEWLTIGFAFKADLSATSHAPMSLWSETNTVQQLTMVVLTTGAIEVRRGTSLGVLLGTSATGLVASDTWVYLEWQCRMHDTLGEARVRVNNTQVLNLTAVDTRATGTTKTVFDSLRISIGAGTPQFCDDLYVAVGSGETFLGDHAIGTPKIIDEPFNNYAVNAWALTGATFAVGRNGAAAQISGTSTNNAVYNIPSADQSDTLTVGFAWRYDDVGAGAQRDVMQFRSDAGATIHNTLAVIPGSGATGTVGFLRGTGGGINIGFNNSVPTLVRNAWYYFEVQVKLHDTTGYVIVRLNGTTIINTATIDTKNAGTKTVYDQISLITSLTGAIGQYDDLYLRNDTTFEGDHALGVAKILDEPFNDLTKWTYESGVGGIVTGRNGSGFQITSGSYHYPIAAASRSPLMTVGFAVRFASLSAAQGFLHFRMGALPGSVDLSLRVEIDGSLTARRGTTTIFATSSVGLITAGTWAYVEVSAFHQNAGGIYTVRVNGTAVISFTGDTNSGFLDTDVFSAIGLVGTAGQTVTFDDLYLRNDATFEGDHAIGAAAVKVYNGSAFVSAPVKVWNGSAFVDAAAVKSWNGSAFV